MRIENPRNLLIKAGLATGLALVALSGPDAADAQEPSASIPPTSTTSTTIPSASQSQPSRIERLESEVNDLRYDLYLAERDVQEMSDDIDGLETLAGLGIGLGLGGLAIISAVNLNRNSTRPEGSDETIE